MQMRDAINAVMRREDLSFNSMHALMRQIMTGEASDAQIGGLLVGLAMKGESAEEISAAALQFVRKISGYRQPTKVNEAAFNTAVVDIARASRRMLESLTTRSASKQL